MFLKRSASVLKKISHVQLTSTRFYSAIGETQENDGKLDYYRKLNAKNADEKPKGWDSAKPFQSIPGPKPLPILGNTLRFFPGGEFYKKDFFDVQKILRKQYGDLVLLSGILSLRDTLLLFDVKDIEMLHRNEGVWPIRASIPSIIYYRSKIRTDIGSAGVASVNGEEWFKLRSMVNPIMLQPKNVLLYVDKMNQTCDDFVDHLNFLAGQNSKGEMPEDFVKEISKFTLETVGLITTDTSLGCLKRDLPKNSDVKKMIDVTFETFELLFYLERRPSLWKYYSTPVWKKFVKNMDFLTDMNLKYLNEAATRISLEKPGHQSEETTILEKLLEIDPKLALPMALDTLLAGVDTTAKILGAALYYLAKNPEKQNALRRECIQLLPEKNSPITKEVLSKAEYLKATVKETTRLAPIGPGNSRETVKDLVFGGYQVPKGTRIITGNLVLSQSDEHYPKAEEFMPERWLSTTKNEFSHKNTSPFVSMPFGFGPRSCLGRRLSHLELEMAVMKVVRNFQMSWPHEDMVFETRFFYGLAKPLKIHMKPL